MGETRKQPQVITTLAESNREFCNYLDTLLAEVDAPVEDMPVTQIKVTTPGAATYNQERSVLHEAIESQPGVDLSYRELQADQSIAVATIPDWMKGAFQVLMFEICGVSLGVPLVTLAGILKISEPLCRLPGQPVWHFGVLTHRSKRVVAVDTKWLIMPERVEPGSDKPVMSGSHLLLIGEGEYGLLVDTIKTAEQLEHADVSWRHDSGQRAWLAGIITNRLSVLLNVDALLGMIKEYEQ